MLKKIAIVYPFIPHYRLPVFRELKESKSASFTIYSGDSTNMSSMNIVSKLDNDCDVMVEWVNNTWLPKGFLWQSGLFNYMDHDVVIFLGDYRYISTWIFSLLLRLKGKQVYFWTHGTRKRELGLKGKIRRAFYSISTGLLLYGDRAKTLLSRDGYPNRKMHVIYNSLDFNLQCEVFAENEPSRKELDFIYVGRVLKGRSLEILFDALNKMNDGTDSFSLSIIGAGEDLEYYKNMSENFDFSIRFYGAIYDEAELARLIMAHKVAVIPGDLGLTAMHCLGYGVPVISHNKIERQKPESEVLIHGKTGSYYEYGNSYSLVDEMKRVHKDYDTYSLACRSIIAEKYTPSKQVEAILKAIDSGGHNAFFGKDI